MPDDTLQDTRIADLLSSVPPALALLAGMELRVFTEIGDSGATCEEIARRLELDPDRLSRLLYALVVVGQLRVEGDQFHNTPEAAALLIEGRPGYLGASFELYAKLWKADLNTAASIREQRPLAEHDFRNAGPAEAIAFMRGSMSSARSFGRALAGRFDLAACRSVIDIGGGPGGVLLGLQESLPDLEATLFDLPQVLEHATAVLAEHGLTGTLAIEAGDITAGPPRGRHDVAILRAVVQVLSRHDAAGAILNAAQALTPGGKLFISGRGVLDNDRLGPRNGVFVNLTFLNLYSAGESYTEDEYRTWMSEAGLTGIERTQLPDGTEILFGNRTA